MKKLLLLPVLLVFLAGCYTQLSTTRHDDYDYDSDDREVYISEPDEQDYDDGTINNYYFSEPGSFYGDNWSYYANPYYSGGYWDSYYSPWSWRYRPYYYYDSYYGGLIGVYNPYWGGIYGPVMGPYPGYPIYYDYYPYYSYNRTGSANYGRRDFSRRGSLTSGGPNQVIVRSGANSSGETSVATRPVIKRKPESRKSKIESRQKDKVRSRIKKEKKSTRNGNRPGYDRKPTKTGSSPSIKSPRRSSGNRGSRPASRPSIKSSGNSGKSSSGSRSGSSSRSGNSRTVKRRN